VGNPYGVDAVPHIAAKITGRMTFLQRVFSFIMYSLDVILMVPYDYYQNVVYKRYFPADKYRSYDDAHRNVSLFLINNHFSQDHIRPLIPGMVEVGGLQIKAKPSPLPDVSFLCFLIEFWKISLNNLR
jgi:glucuronosyltransferase